MLWLCRCLPPEDQFLSSLHPHSAALIQFPPSITLLQFLLTSSSTNPFSARTRWLNTKHNHITFLLKPLYLQNKIWILLKTLCGAACLILGLISDHYRTPTLWSSHTAPLRASCYFTSLCLLLSYLANLHPSSSSPKAAFWEDFSDPAELRVPCASGPPLHPACTPSSVPPTALSLFLCICFPFLSWLPEDLHSQTMGT